MDPYARAAFDFSKAYLMNMRAADEQRQANKPTSNAFAQSVDDEESDYGSSPTPQAPVSPSEQSDGMDAEGGVILDHSNGSAMTRAKQKVSKYLQERS